MITVNLLFRVLFAQHFIRVQAPRIKACVCVMGWHHAAVDLLGHDLGYAAREVSASESFPCKKKGRLLNTK